MSFLDRYNQELRILRESGSRFAAEHPQIASQLGLRGDSVTDPFVERLLEGLAFLTARVHARLDRESAEFAMQALSVLSPLFGRATPSMVTLDFSPDWGSPEAFRIERIPKSSVVSAQCPDRNQPVSFVTTRDLRLWPLRLTGAACVKGLPHLPLAMSTALANAQALIQLDFALEGGVKAEDLAKNAADSGLLLSLAGDLPKAFELHRALVSDTAEVWLLADGEQRQAVRLPPGCLVFDAVQDAASVFPPELGALPGLRVLREYFAYPQKFLSVKLDVLAELARLAPTVKAFSVVFKLKRVAGSLIGGVEKDQLRLFAVPCVNLYPKRFDPVPYDEGKTGQWLVADRMHPTAHHVWSVEKVAASMSDGAVLEAWSALNMGDFYASNTHARYAWRRETLDVGSGSRRDNGLDALGVYDEISLALTDSTYRFGDIHHIQVEGLVCDRGWRPASAMNAQFALKESKAVERIECLWPASVARPMPDASDGWSAVPQLGDNPLTQFKSLPTDITDRVRDVLRTASDKTQSVDAQRCASLRQVVVQTVFMEAGRTTPMAWVRGQRVAIHVASSDHPDNGAWLFARVVAQALSESVYLNDGVEFEIFVDNELCSVHSNLGSAEGVLQ